MARSALEDLGNDADVDVPAMLSGNTARTVELTGRQDIGELVHRGRVRLSTGDGSSIDLWDPVPTGDGTIHRVQLAVQLSAEMLSRYPEPLPDNPETITWSGDYVDVESGFFNKHGFEIANWIHPGRWLTLQSIQKVELF